MTITKLAIYLYNPHYMVNVSTKTGDKGETSLANGQRIAKDDLVVELIGTLDELNSQLGLVRTKLKIILKESADKELLAQERIVFLIQKQLFVLGAYVAQADIKLSVDFLQKIEQQSTNLQELMADNWHSRFVLPGGHEVAALLDIARSVCRRLERIGVTYQRNQSVDDLLLKTINRLSDYLYVLRCFVNEKLAVEEHYI
ncbi:MAG: cob(I)yrinic acid a,c-diamide adenosyltransferase [Patescibacteria group bacterium]